MPIMRQRLVPVHTCCIVDAKSYCLMRLESQLVTQVVCLLCCRTSELVKFFAEEAYSVALHPTGLSVLVGFADKLRLLVVLMDDLR